MDIEEFQKKVIEFRDARDWAQLAGQSSAAFVRNFGVPRRTDDRGQRTGRKVRGRVKEELGDILIYALNMCHAFSFDPSEVILEKLDINERKYPVEKAKGSAKKYGENGF